MTPLEIEMLVALQRAHNDLLFMEDRNEETIGIVRAAIRRATCDCHWASQDHLVLCERHSRNA